ncbi:MAG: bifunctional (p)ppGpp synthetase/guanosine-3',5'-bis(diphosphate) 3'-pyrophosphohydrolase [Deltaproteobacteria bacterium]|nr:bifunctional (p)ppGpp synthetase/guanosine-3',5'-bis(diphosphate) 3'-pyrophosphohydrolase [Deltaproteobacteria bacterium]
MDRDRQDATGSDIVRRARNFATERYARIGQRQRRTDSPYQLHLKAVARIVQSVGARPEVVAAAWLHDVVEDTPATFGDIEAAFGPDVARLVAEVTTVSRPSDGNRATRRALDRVHLAAASAEGKTVKLADLLDTCRDLGREDPRSARAYLAEAALLLPVLADGEPTLYRRARILVHEKTTALGRAEPDASEDAVSIESEGARSPQPLRFSRHRIERLFSRLFTVKDIAEPLRSFDAGHASSEAAATLEAQKLEVAGVRENGVVVGYVRRIDLAAGACRDHLRRFAADQVMPADASLSDAIQVLTRHNHAFVSAFDAIAGTVSRADIQKPIVRMWLFGMITLLEMDLAKRIRTRWPDGSWTAHVPPARLAKAKALFEERQRRGQAGELLDCLQLPDKAQVLLDEPEELAAFGLDTRSNARRVLKDLESLRNNLAHAQDIVTQDWPQVARMTRRVEVLDDEG